MSTDTGFIFLKFWYTFSRVVLSFTEKLHRDYSTESFQIPLISLHRFSLLLTSCVSVVQIVKINEPVLIPFTN